MTAINSSSSPQQYCLKWNSFTSNMSEMFQEMLMHELLVDCTLACDGLAIKAHKLILAACSPYFQGLFAGITTKNPIVHMKDVKFQDLKAIIDFIYSGEVNIPMDQLSSLLATAESLKIKGLSDFNERQSAADRSNNNITTNNNNNNNNNNSLFNPVHSTPLSKVLTMQNPASNLSSSNNFASFKGIKRKRFTRSTAEMAQSSLRNLSAIAQRTNSAAANTVPALKISKQMLSNVKSSNGLANSLANASDKARIEAAARLLNSQFVKEHLKAAAAAGGGSGAGSSDDDRDEGPNNGKTESNNNRHFKNGDSQHYDGDEKDEEEFEPTKLLEQSMSTPEVSTRHSRLRANANRVRSQNAQLEYEDNEGSEEEAEVQRGGNDDGFSSNNSNQELSLLSGNSNPPQSNKSMQEYEQILSEIQAKNLTVCPICGKEFIKKSKLIRHYHTHFSDFRPKFSCVFCGKLFTTQDWCKRHALNCQLKNYHGVNGSNMGDLMGSDFKMDSSEERDI